MRVSMSAMGSVIMSAEPSCEILRLVLDRLLWNRSYFCHWSLLLVSVTGLWQWSLAFALASVLVSKLNGSVMHVLPTRLSNSRDAALIGELPEADTTKAEFPVHGSRPAAQHATLYLAG
jgi:hypothetical protein